MPEAPEQRSRRRRNSAPAKAGWWNTAVPLLPVVACLLGGATEKWAEGVVVAALGLLLLLNPPRFSLGAAFNSIAIALIATAATAFLPARWFAAAAWREALVNDFAVNVGSQLSPQPWISFGCFLSLIAGLSWAYFVSAQDLDHREVRHQLRVFAGGVGLLAALCIALYFAHRALPFWHNERGFGPFPNRNQTGDLLGITSVVILACGQDDIRQGRKRWIAWAAAFVVMFVAVVLNFSRAGVAILVAGSALWLSSFALRRGSGVRIALGASALLALLTMMLLFGGETLERFHLRGGGVGVTSDFRWLVFRDTWQLIRASSWFGIGLGNFEPVFAVVRDVSMVQSKALHPESDWLWAWTEIGWPGIALVIAGATVLLRRAFPLSEGTNQRFRVAALIAALLFGLHDLVDVSAHRVGSSYAGILLLGLALRRPLELRASVWLAAVFRAVGFLLLITGGVWVIATAQHAAVPGGIGADNARRAAAAANEERRFADTIADADRGLRWAPLDWRLYFLRALGKVGAARPPADALEDFRRARFLEPSSFEVPYQEGLAWVTRQPMLAVTAWREALRRAGPQRAELYNRILSVATQANLSVARMVEDLGFGQHDLAVAFLERVKGAQFTRALQRLLLRDPDLQTFTPAERSKVFDLWAEQGDVAQLAAFVEGHPDQLSIAWRGVAKQHAAQHDFRTAFELAKRFSAPPVLPAKPGNSSIQQLERELYATPNNYAVGFALYDAQMRAGSLDDALATIRHFTDDRNAPPYFRFLEAQCWAAKNDYERAWTAWSAFDRATAK